MAIPMPGPYEVAQTLQEILQRRREEAARAAAGLLDQEQLALQKRETDASIEAQRAQTEQGAQQLALQRAQETRLKEAQYNEELDRRLDRSIPGQPITDPELLARAEKVGAMVQTPDVMPAGVIPFRARVPESGVEDGQELPIEEFDPTIKGQRVYAGPPEIARQDQINARLRELMSDPNFQNMTTVEKFLTLRSVGLQDVPEFAIQGSKTFRVLPWNFTGSVEVGPDEQVELGPQPNQLSAANRPVPYQAFDRRTGALIATTPPLDFESFQVYMATNPDHILRPIGWQPNNSNTRSSIQVPGGTVLRASELMGAIDGLIRSRANAWTQGGRNQIDGQIASLRSELTAIITSISGQAPPELNDLADDIASDPELDTLPLSELDDEDGTPLAEKMTQRDLQILNLLVQWKRMGNR